MLFEWFLVYVPKDSMNCHMAGILNIWNINGMFCFFILWPHWLYMKNSLKEKDYTLSVSGADRSMTTMNMIRAMNLYVYEDSESFV